MWRCRSYLSHTVLLHPGQRAGRESPFVHMFPHMTHTFIAEAGGALDTGAENLDPRPAIIASDRIPDS